MDELNHALSLRHELRKLLETVKDRTDIETGCGAGEGDLYRTVHREFRITVASG
jgi:hypothetical protein